MSAQQAPADRFQVLANALCDGSLMRDEQEELAALASANPERRRELIDLCCLHTALSLELKAQRYGRALGGQIDAALAAATTVDPAAPAESQAAEVSQASAYEDDRWSLSEAAKRLVYDYMTLSAVVATLTMTIILLSLALIVPDWGRSTPNVAEVDAPRPVVVARITATHQAAWDASSDANFKNIELFAGERLVLAGGFAEVTFEDGAVVMLHGPCDLVLESAQLAELRSGKLTARYDVADSGFRVRTSVAEITDLGTEFGVSAGEDDSCLVHVFEGAVEVVALHHTNIRTLRAGETLLVDAERSLPVSDRPIAFLRVAQLSKTAAGNVLADARADFAEVAAGEATQTQNRPGLPSSGGGYWNYYESIRPNPTDPEADLQLLQFGPAGGTRHGMFHGTGPLYRMPAISAAQIFNGSGDGAPRTNELAIHPGDQEAKFVVIRWTPDDDVPRVIHVRGHVRMLGTEHTTDGVTFRIVAGGKTMLEKSLAAADNKGVTFDRPIQLQGNEMIEFVFDPNISFYNDQLGFSATITEFDQAHSAKLKTSSE